MNYVYLVVCALFMGFGCSLASTNVRLEITPANVTQGDGRIVEISCTASYPEVLMISLKNGTGSPFVFVRGGSRVTVHKGTPSRIQASGLLSPTGTEHFLKVNISDPLMEDSGIYTCNVAYLDADGFMITDRSQAVLTVEEAPVPEIVTTETPGVVTFSAESILYNLLDRLVQIEMNGDLQPYWIIGLTDQEREDLMKGVAENKTLGVFDKDSMKMLMDRLAKLESFVFTTTAMRNASNSGGGSKTGANPTTDKKLVERVGRLENENANMTRQIEWLSEQAKPDPTAATMTTDVLKRVDELEKESSKQSQDLATLATKDSTTTAFHSTFNEVGVNLVKGMVLGFPHIITQKGHGFDPRSGIFTAPTDGLYGFHLLIDNTGTGICKIVLKADSRYFSLLVTGNADDEGQTSTSSVIELKAGEKVMAVVIEVDGQVLLRGWSYSTFTGYLIWSN